MKRKNVLYHTRMSSQLKELLLLFGITFVFILNGCAMTESETAESIPQEFFAYSDNTFTLINLDWWISWENVKEIKEISAEDITVECGIENYINSSLWADIGDCEVQEGYFFTEDNQLYSGMLDVTTSSTDTAQAILNAIIQWTKTALPEPASNPEFWKQDTDVIVDSFLNLASGSSQQNIWDAGEGGTLNLLINSFEPTGSMTITLSASAPRNTGGTVRRSIADKFHSFVSSRQEGAIG